ncbi:MAG TPA: GIY-YIG nuclease family protein [Bacteroidia bacterium]|jgi:putative endonuclease|nr:GIY-YIG nuclease family protein [Bacteroidia bacterium]
MKTMYVYILECIDGSYYTGVTNNAEKRLIEHNTGVAENSYTCNRRPVKMVFCHLFNSPEQAIAFEKKIKKWSRAKKKAIIEGNWELLPELSKSKKNKLIQAGEEAVRV